MAEFPAFPLWTDAYLADTGHLTTLEHGAYLLLLMAMWRTSEKNLPADDIRLARIAHLNMGQWRRIKPTMMEFFKVENGRITQGRLTDEATFVRQRSESQSSNAKARWLKPKETGDATASVRQCQTDAPTPTPTPTEETIAKAIVVKAHASKVNNMAMSYNAVAERIGLATCAKITEPRRRALLKIPISEWDEALRKLEASSFCRGTNGKWRASIDFLLQPSSRQKLLEGAYDDHGNASPTRFDAMLAGVLAAAGGGHAGQAVEPLPAGSQITGSMENADGGLSGSPGAVSGRSH